MRRRYLRVLPALSFHYGLKPWELAALTSAELEQFVEQLPKQG